MTTWKDRELLKQAHRVAQTEVTACYQPLEEFIEDLQQLLAKYPDATVNTTDYYGEACLEITALETAKQVEARLKREEAMKPSRIKRLKAELAALEAE
jgi:hypothetical protein